MGAMTWYPVFFDHYRSRRYDDALKIVHTSGSPRLWMTHACYAAVHGQMGNAKDSAAALTELKTQRPEFQNDARGHLKRCTGSSETVDPLLDGLRKAGLDIPDDPN